MRSSSLTSPLTSASEPLRLQPAMPLPDKPASVPDFDSRTTLSAREWIESWKARQSSKVPTSTVPSPPGPAYDVELAGREKQAAKAWIAQWKETQKVCGPGRVDVKFQKSHTNLLGFRTMLPTHHLRQPLLLQWASLPYSSRVGPHLPTEAQPYHKPRRPHLLLRAMMTSSSKN